MNQPQRQQPTDFLNNSAACRFRSAMICSSFTRCGMAGLKSGILSTVSIAFLAAAGCFRLRPPGCFAFAGLRFFGFASSSGSIFPAIVSTACCTRLLTFSLLCPTALCTLK
uniref:Uncharacterized protein n=1 Tax=Anopheles merus TaxID=30066 RepID=A0A182VN54_ANOME